MAFDFPASPSEGAVYTPAGGPSYTFTGGIWRLLPTPQTALSSKSIGDVPPLNPVHGQSWWKSDTGESFIWYVDANSGQWVQESDTSLPDAMSDGKFYGRKDGLWSAVTGEAPSDGYQYVRKSGVWTSIGPGSVGVYLVTGAPNQLNVIIPVGCRRMRLTGYLKPNTANTNIFIRLSKDNGSTWLSGATDYANTLTTQNAASVAGSSVTGVFGFISYAASAPSVATRLIDAEFLFPADATEVCQWNARSVGYTSPAATNYTIAGLINQFGPFTNILIGCDAVTFTVTGRLIAECDA